MSAALVLAAASTSLLSVLKYVLLIILWLFFLLVLRAVLTEVRRPAASIDSTRAPVRSPAASRFAGGTSPPRSEPGPPVFIAPAVQSRFSGAKPEPQPTQGQPVDPYPFDPPSPAEPPPADRARAADAALTTAPPPAKTSVGGLTVREPARGAGRSYPLDREATLGRAPVNTVALPEDSFVSSIHARLWRQADQVVVEDLGSTNGTFVNGVRLSAPVALHPGDRLQVGRTVFEATK